MGQQIDIVEADIELGSNLGDGDDVDKELASKLKNDLVHVSPMSAHSCIFRVPTILKRQNEKLFEPVLVSIGPYHRHQQNLKPMKDIKLWYLKNLTERVPDKSLECFSKSIRANFDYCFQCYAEPVTMDKEEFIEMMVIDGCFIIEFFRRWKGIVQKTADDPCFTMAWIQKTLVLDLLLLENQLPWFVLDTLYNLTKANSESNSTLPQLVHDCLFWDTLRHHPIPVDSSLRHKHLLGFQRNIIVSDIKVQPTEGYFTSTPSVTELRQAGVKFEKGKDTVHLTKIQFKNGVLVIPPIVIVDNAESFFRNLIAYEQCDRSLEDKFTAYAGFLDNLINSREDLDHLHKRGIITFFLTTEVVSTFFNSLYVDAHITYSPYKELTEEITKYYRTPWRRWRATLSKDYFNSPWKIISLIVAITLLGVGLVQAVKAFY